MENVLSEQELAQNIKTQKTGEGEFVVSGSESGAASLFGPPKSAIKKVKKKFEPSFIPGTSTVTSREVITDLSKITNLPKLEDVIPTKNDDMRNEIDGMVGYKDKTGEIIPFSENTDVDTKIRIMNLGAATDFVYRREDGEFASVKIPYDRQIAKMITEPPDYKPPSVRAIKLKATSIEKAYTGPDASFYEPVLLKQKKDQGRFPSYLPLIGGDKIGVTLDNALGTNFDEVGGQIALAKAYNKILIKAGLNERQRYGILKERTANKFKDLFNIMGYGRRGVRYGIVEAPIFIIGEAYDFLEEKLKEFAPDFIQSGLKAVPQSVQNFKDSVGRANFYDMIMPLQANIIQDGFASQNINIDIGTAELLASMFTATPQRLVAIAAEIGLPSRVAQKITEVFGKSEVKKYRAYREKKLVDLKIDDTKEIPKDFDKKLIDEYAEYRAKSAPFLNKIPIGELPILGTVYTKINSIFTGPKLVHGLQIEEASKALSDNPIVKNKLATLETLKTQRTKLVDSKKGKFDFDFNKRLNLLDKQIDMVNDDLRYEIATSNVPTFIKDIAKQNKAMIIGSASFGQLAQEGAGDVQIFEMIGLFGGLSYAMATNQRTLLSRIRTINQYFQGGKKSTQNFTEELAKRINTFSPEFSEVLAKRIKYIDDLQQDLIRAGVSEEVLNTSFSTMSGLAILQTLEETARTDMNIKNIAKFNKGLEDFQEISKLKKQLLVELKEATLRIADIKRQGGETSALDKFDKTVNIAYDYAVARAKNLDEDIKLLQDADLAKIESIIKGTVGKLEDSPVDNQDISTVINRNYKHGYNKAEFLSAEEIAQHNKKVNDTVVKAIKDKAKSLNRPRLLKQASKLVKSKIKDADKMPEYRNTDDLFIAFGENKRNFENAEVSKHYNQLDEASFIDGKTGKLVGKSAKVEGMKILERFLSVLPDNEVAIFKEIGGGTMGTSKQFHIFKGFNQAADETINNIFEKLPQGSGFKTADEFVDSVIANAPDDMQNFKHMPKNLRAVYIMHKQGETNGVTVDSLPLGFDQLKELKSSFGRLQAKYYKPDDTFISNQFKELREATKSMFGEFQVNFGTKESRMVGDLFILDKQGNRIPVLRKLDDGDSAHQVYMNRYFDNKTNFNYFFKGRDKTVPSNIDPSGITLDQKPSFTENVDKIFKMDSNELSSFQGDFLKRFGTFKDETPMGLPKDVQREGVYSLDVDSEDGKAMTAILELKVAEYINDAVEKGQASGIEFQRKLLKLQQAYMGVDSKGNKKSLINVSKIEKDLFTFSPASVGQNLYEKGSKALEDGLRKISSDSLIPLREVYQNYKQVERNLRSVLPVNVREGETLIEVATANPQKLKQVKEGIMLTYKGSKKDLDNLITEVFMEDLLQKTFQKTGGASVLGSAKEMVTDVDMDVDKLKKIIGFNDQQRNNMVKGIIGEDRMKTLNSMVKWMSEQYDIEKIRANITGIPRNFSVESYISRFYSINRGVISARYVGTEAVLQQFRLSGHKLFKVIIEDPKVGQLFLEIVKTGQPLSREKEIQFFNALVTNLNKLNVYASSQNPQQTVVINDNYKAKYTEYDISDQSIEARQ